VSEKVDLLLEIPAAGTPVTVLERHILEAKKLSG
jgi:hypothetical protein